VSMALPAGLVVAPRLTLVPPRRYTVPPDFNSSDEEDPHNNLIAVGGDAALVSAESMDGDNEAELWEDPAAFEDPLPPWKKAKASDFHRRPHE
jgi:hypothetical protein